MKWFGGKMFQTILGLAHTVWYLKIFKRNWFAEHFGFQLQTRGTLSVPFCVNLHNSNAESVVLEIFQVSAASLHLPFIPLEWDSLEIGPRMYIFKTLPMPFVTLNFEKHHSRKYTVSQCWLITAVIHLFSTSIMIWTILLHKCFDGFSIMGTILG